MNKSNQAKLEEVLKHKGIGPAGSKSLKAEQLDELKDLLLSGDTSLTTQASLFTAFSLLPNQPIEVEWFAKAQKEYFAQEVRNIKEHSHPLAKLLTRVLNAENLNFDESKKALGYLLDDDCPEYLKGAFLEGQRVKRETHEENLGFLKGLIENSDHRYIDDDVVIDVADNYDGYNRTPCLTPFVAAILAACGFKTVIHGVEFAAPKMGKTSYQVLKHTNYKVNQSLDEAKSALEDANRGWAYIDQSQSFKGLHKLLNMRKEMVKRPMLATFEKMLQPLRSTKGNYLAMGYTHTAYKEHLSKLIVEYGLSSKAMIVRGVEGTSRPALSRRSICLWFDGAEVHEEFFDPKEFGIDEREEGLDKEGTSLDSYNIGLSILKNEPNEFRDSLVYWATCLIAGFRLLEDVEAIKMVEEVIENKKALKHFESACNA